MFIAVWLGVAASERLYSLIATIRTQNWFLSYQAHDKQDRVEAADLTYVGE